MYINCNVVDVAVFNLGLAGMKETAMSASCAVDGCFNDLDKHSARGMCTMHYLRWVRYGSTVDHGTPQGLSVHERLYRNVMKNEAGCLIWMGKKNKHGYGALNIDGKAVLTHRAAWQDKNGPIPAGAKVLHVCDTPGCINSDHLSLGTQADNVADMHAKGRARKRGVKGEENYAAKLSDDGVAWIRSCDLSNAEVARQLGVSNTLVSKIRIGQTWTHIHMQNIRESRGKFHLDENSVREIRASDVGPTALGRKYGVTASTIVDIRKRRSWRHIA